MIILFSIIFIVIAIYGLMGVEVQAREAARRWNGDAVSMERRFKILGYLVGIVLLSFGVLGLLGVIDPR